MQKTYNLQLTEDQAIALDSFLCVINEECCGNESDVNAIFDMLKIAVDHEKKIATDGLEAVRSYFHIITLAKEYSSDLIEIQEKAFQLIINED